MSDSAYFFFVSLLTVAAVRVFMVWNLKGPTVKGFRVRHYMYGLILMIAGLVTHLLLPFAVGWGLLIDELPIILRRGPGHKDEHWHGCDDYHTRWAFAGVLVFIVLTYLFRESLAGLV